VHPVGSYCTDNISVQ